MATWRQVKHSWSDRLSLLLGQWFLSGRSKYAPGTCGSAAAIPFFFALREIPLPLYWAVTALVSLGGIGISNRCAALLGEKDPSSVVIDEVAGVFIAMGCVMHGPLWVLGLAWGLFRLFDITKPWIIDRVQYLQPPGLGIMADDLLAGACAGGICWGLIQVL